MNAHNCSQCSQSCGLRGVGPCPCRPTAGSLGWIELPQMPEIVSGITWDRALLYLAIAALGYKVFFSKRTREMRQVRRKRMADANARYAAEVAKIRQETRL